MRRYGNLRRQELKCVEFCREDSHDFYQYNYRDKYQVITWTIY